MGRQAKLKRHRKMLKTHDYAHLVRLLDNSCMSDEDTNKILSEIEEGLHPIALWMPDKIGRFTLENLVSLRHVVADFLVYIWEQKKATLPVEFTPEEIYGKARFLRVEEAFVTGVKPSSILRVVHPHVNVEAWAVADTIYDIIKGLITEGKAKLIRT